MLDRSHKNKSRREIVNSIEIIHIIFYITFNNLCNAYKCFIFVLPMNKIFFMYCITYLFHNTEKEYFFCQSVIHIEHKHETVESNRFSSFIFPLYTAIETWYIMLNDAFIIFLFELYNYFRFYNRIYCVSSIQLEAISF